MSTIGTGTISVAGHTSLTLRIAFVGLFLWFYPMVGKCSNLVYSAVGIGISATVPLPKKASYFTVYTAKNVANVQAYFKKIGYILRNKVQDFSSIPQVQPSQMPVDIKAIKILSQRKHFFKKMLLPLAVQINKDIIQKRKAVLHLCDMYGRTKTFSESTVVFLQKIYAELSIRKNITECGQIKNVLKRRLDSIPISLILAQAAIESGWGTSRFAVQGNALFGQWSYDDNQGIVPLRRDVDKMHKIKSFARPYVSVESYAKNLNSHPAYAKFRQIRYTLRQKKRPVTGLKLADGLYAYSKEGGAYVQKIKDVITINSLDVFDTLTLR